LVYLFPSVVSDRCCVYNCHDCAILQEEEIAEKGEETWYGHF